MSRFKISYFREPVRPDSPAETVEAACVEVHATGNGEWVALRDKAARIVYLARNVQTVELLPDEPVALDAESVLAPAGFISSFQVPAAEPGEGPQTIEYPQTTTLPGWHTVGAAVPPLTVHVHGDRVTIDRAS